MTHSLWTRAHLSVDRVERRIGRAIHGPERERLVDLYTQADPLVVRRAMLYGVGWRVGVKKTVTGAPWLGFVRAA